jgi:hypothetical protein
MVSWNGMIFLTVIALCLKSNLNYKTASLGLDALDLIG